MTDCKEYTMSTLGLFCKCFRWQGGTIHQAKERFGTASKEESDRFCTKIAANTTNISDIKTALWFLEHRVWN